MSYAALKLLLHHDETALARSPSGQGLTNHDPCRRSLFTAALPPAMDQPSDSSPNGAVVESRMGAVAWGHRPTLRFPSPLIKPSVPISGTRLSDWLHHKAHDVRPLYAGVQR